MAHNQFYVGSSPTAATKDFMKKVLLVGKYSVIEPLGLMYLAGSLKKVGHSVDMLLIDKPVDIPEGYDYIGFSVYTGFHLQMFLMAMKIEKSKVILGGPHMTKFFEEGKKFADYVVVGEGIKSVVDICNGEACEGIVSAPLIDIEDFPEIDRETLYNYDNRFRDNKIKNVMTSFGCPYDCFYCYNVCYRGLYPDFKVRSRSVESVIDECEKIKRDYPIELIYFQDDCFGFDMKWLKEFSQKYPEKAGVFFHCQLRPEMVNKDRLDLLVVAGCTGITIAVETLNEKVRRERLNRQMSNEKIITACKLIKEYGFNLRTEQMLGLPETTIEDELGLLKFNVSLKPELAWTSIFTPYLGTKLGDWCKENGLYDGCNDDLSDNFFSDTRLKFDSERKYKTNLLHKIFATCARLPYGDELARRCLDDYDMENFDVWFAKVKKHLFDYELYNVTE